MANYGSGETTDWDNGMIVAAIFKAVARSILASPANHVDDVELLADVFDSADPRAYGVLPFPRTDFGEKSGDAMIAECIAYGRQGTDPKEDPDADRSEEHTSELQSLMRNSYAVFCLNNKKQLLSNIQH